MPHIGEMMARLPQPPSIQSLVVGASPSSHAVPDDGRIVVQGGTVSLVEIGRSGTFVTTGLTTAVIPVSRGDTLRVTYVVAPTLSYFRN